MSSEGKHDHCVYKIYLFMYVFMTKYVMDLEYIKKRHGEFSVLIDIKYYSSSHYNYHFIILKRMNYLVFLGNEIFLYGQLIIIIQAFETQYNS